MSKSGLSNIQIDRELRYCKGFHGAIIKDELIFPLKYGSYICNLGTYSHGTHWVACIIKPNEQFYFDSYGTEPFQSLVDHYPHIQWNHIQIQPLDTIYCGNLCIDFIRFMNHESFDCTIHDMIKKWMKTK